MIRRVLLAVFYVAIVFLLLRFSGLLSREGMLPLVDNNAIVRGPAPTLDTCDALCQCKADVHGGRFYCGDDWKRDPFFNEDGIVDDDDVNSAVDVISDKAAHGDTNSRHSVNRTSNVINFPHICGRRASARSFMVHVLFII